MSDGFSMRAHRVSSLAIVIKCDSRPAGHDIVNSRPVTIGKNVRVNNKNEPQRSARN